MTKNFLKICEKAPPYNVGVFDSGIGGLNVLSACIKLLPPCTYYYLGDNLRAPYGSRPEGEILAFVREAMDVFASCGVDAVVLACNTATAVCADILRREYPFPIVGMEPAVKPAAQVCRNVLVLATPRTASSARLKGLIARFPDRNFTVHAAPALAGEIERALPKGERVELSRHIPRGQFDGVVLGCTHYSFLKTEIAHFCGARVFDGSEGTAKRLCDVLGFDQIPEKSGTRNHFSETTNPNNCLTFFQSKLQQISLNFLGNGAKINQNLFFRTFVFRKN